MGAISIDIQLSNPATPPEDLDVIRVKQMLLLCVEIVSPTQTGQDILPKFRAYFALGVKSCWYVDPNLKLIQVYFSPKKSKTFVTQEEVFDPALEIHLPLSKIFSKRYRQKLRSTPMSPKRSFANLPLPRSEPKQKIYE